MAIAGDVLRLKFGYIINAINCVSLGNAEGFSKRVFCEFPMSDIPRRRRGPNAQAAVPGTISTYNPVNNFNTQFLPGVPDQEQGLFAWAFEQQPSVVDSAEERLKLFKSCLQMTFEYLMDDPDDKRLQVLAFPGGIGCNAPGDSWPD